MAFFSAVDIDHVLRKEVNMDCVTPSHPSPIPFGQSLDIYSLLARDDGSLGEPERDNPPFRRLYKPRGRVLGSVRADVDFLDAQITPSEQSSSTKKRRVSGKRTTDMTITKHPLPSSTEMSIGAQARAKPKGRPKFRLSNTNKLV